MSDTPASSDHHPEDMTCHNSDLDKHGEAPNKLDGAEVEENRVDEAVDPPLEEEIEEEEALELLEEQNEEYQQLDTKLNEISCFLDQLEQRNESLKEQLCLLLETMKQEPM